MNPELKTVPVSMDRHWCCKLCLPASCDGRCRPASPPQPVAGDEGANAPSCNLCQPGNCDSSCAPWPDDPPPPPADLKAFIRQYICDGDEAEIAEQVALVGPAIEAIRSAAHAAGKAEVEAERARLLKYLHASQAAERITIDALRKADISHDDACLLSRRFNEGGLWTAQEQRINEWLKATISRALISAPLPPREES